MKDVFLTYVFIYQSHNGAHVVEIWQDYTLFHTDLSAFLQGPPEIAPHEIERPVVEIGGGTFGRVRIFPILAIA